MWCSSNVKRVTKPLKLGDELDVKIEAIGKLGDGVAKRMGFVILIRGVKLDDCVRVKVTNVRDNVAFAKVITRL